MSYGITSLNDHNNIIGISDLLKQNENNPDRNEKMKQIENEVIQNVYDMDIKSDYNFKNEYEKELQKLMTNCNKHNYDTKELDEISDILKNSNKKNLKDKKNIPFSEGTIFSQKMPCDDDKDEKDIDSDIDDLDEYDNNEEEKHSFKLDNIKKNNKDFISEDVDFQRLTKEQKIQQHMDDVIKSMSNNNYQSNTFDVDKEKEEDDKIAIIEQIDTLKEILENDSVNISRIPEVGPNTPLKELKSILKILKLKNDRNRLCSLTEESILMAATSLEYLFDGKKEYLGYKPDLVGWPDTVKIKLRRMRYETSTFASGIMKNYNLGMGSRLALELIPSMFLYNRLKNSSKDINDSRFTDAINDLNKME